MNVANKQTVKCISEITIENNKQTNRQTDKCISESVVNVFFMTVWVEGRSCQNPLTQHHLHPTERQKDRQKVDRQLDNKKKRRTDKSTID